MQLLLPSINTQNGQYIINIGISWSGTSYYVLLTLLYFERVKVVFKGSAFSTSKKHNLFVLFWCVGSMMVFAISYPFIELYSAEMCWVYALIEIFFVFSCFFECVMMDVQQVGY